MSVLGGLLRAGASFCQSAGTLLNSARTISTGTCCQIRMHAIPPLKKVDRWTEKRSMFGVYDNIGILGLPQMPPPQLEPPVPQELPVQMEPQPANLQPHPTPPVTAGYSRHRPKLRRWWISCG
uniref:Large ribosomal subunit protein mL51 n=1 Tax=Lates calcarifer TaxID=8187 RepID=A0A4W6DGL2_LATCA